jgi:protein-tyrosine-phosphatase
MKIKVLFLCATNGIHSVMAEALLRRIDSEHFEAASAAIEAGQVHPLTIEVMKEVGLNLENKIPTPIEALGNRVFDFVITLCNRAKTDCPELLAAKRIHWRLDDPLRSSDVERQRRDFRTLRDQITHRLHLFVLVQVRPRRAA